MATKTFKIGLSDTDKQNMAQDVYEQILALTFAEYDSGETYNEASFAIYEDELYMCKEDNVTGAWDSSKWEQATLNDLIEYVQDGVNEIETAIGTINGKANTSDLESGVIVVAKSKLAKQIENVSEETGSLQNAPFNFQATGTANNTTETPTAPIAKHLKLRGNSVVWNQALASQNYSQTENGVTLTMTSGGLITITGTAESTTDFTIFDYGQGGSFSWIKGHKYIFTFAKDTSISLRGMAASINLYRNTIATCSDNSNAVNRIQIRVLSGTVCNERFYLQLFDITKMYGAGKEPISYEQFVRDFQLPYYQYNAGKLKSCKSKKLVTIGYNQFNALDTDIRVISGQTYRLMYWNGTALANITSGSVKEYDGSKNLIKTTAYGDLSNLHSLDSDYPNNSDKGIELTDSTVYVQLSGISNSNILFNIAWDGTRTEYEPFVKHEYDLPQVELRSVGDKYDYILPNGEYHQVIDSRAYESGDENDSSVITDKTNTYYVLDNEVVTNVASFAENIEVDDFGTMEFVPSDDNLAPIVPQGNEFFYPADYVLFLDDLYTRSKDGGEDADANNIVVKSDLAFKELDSSYIGSITSSEIVSGAFYKNEIAISDGLTNAKYVCALMSNGNLYPMAKTSSSIVCFNGINFQSGSITVSKIYYKE